VTAEFFHADQQTDMQTKRHDEANILFSQFCESTKERTRKTTDDGLLKREFGKAFVVYFKNPSGI